MTAMTPGSNIPLSAARVTVDVAAPVRLDVSGLLLTADGKVRSDDDFIFYNQPTGQGVTYRSGGGTAPDAIVVDTSAVPPGIEKIVVTASPDAAGQTFQGIEPTATIRNADDNSVLATFTPPQLGTETALVIVEVYLRNGAWKARAVGQGYANGLAGIATDFGVTVETTGGPGPAGDPAGAPGGHAPGPARRGPHHARRTSGPARRAVGPRPGHRQDQPRQGPGQPPRRTRPSPSSRAAGRCSPRSRWGSAGSPPTAARTSTWTRPSSPTARSATTSTAATSASYSIVNGAIKHSGDNLTGEGGGDDEVIVVDLGRLPQEVSGLVFTVNSFSGQKFTEVAKAYCRLIDAASGEELVRFDLTSAEPQTGVMMAKLIRQYSGEWDMTAMGEFVKSRTVRRAW
ncbi:hypothetical protein SVIOM342S_03470 [Streptomyces violaceorubidus]